MNLMTKHIFKEVYQYVHYLDINDDDEYIDHFRISILKNVKYQNLIKRIAHFSSTQLLNKLHFKGVRLNNRRLVGSTDQAYSSGF